jgi:hypothetical protein
MRLIARAALIVSAVALASAADAQLMPGGGGGGPAPGSASSDMITQFNADQFAQLVTAAGFASKSAVSQDNKTHFVLTQFWPNTGSGLFGLCNTTGACPAYAIITELVNQQGIGDPWTDAWNSKFAFVKAVKNGTSLIFEMDVILGPGVTAAYVESTAKVYKSVVDQSTNFNPNQP